MQKEIIEPQRRRERRENKISGFVATFMC